jgi:hypothetical protein
MIVALVFALAFFGNLAALLSERGEDPRFAGDKLGYRS